MNGTGRRVRDGLRALREAIVRAEMDAGQVPRARVTRRRMALALVGAAALVAGGIAPRSLGAQAPGRGPVPEVYVRDAGPGRPGRLLRGVLALRHVTLLADSGEHPPLALRRDSTFDTTVVVIGGSASVASHVRGDVVVVGGDLFLHPGAEIDGRAIAVGGGVYNSTLAVVHGGRESWRSVTFVATRTARGIALDWREVDRYEAPLVELIGLQGFGLPRYDRSDGLSLGWGPLVNVPGGRMEIEPSVTYRSHLGKVDPSGELRYRQSRTTMWSLSGGRGTSSNEGWIRGDIANSLGSLLSGIDTRNWWRSDRAEGRVTHTWEGETVTANAYVGGLYENDWSTGPDTLTTTHWAWSLLERTDVEKGIRRPNPPVLRGHVASTVAGGAVHWEDLGLVADLGARVEVPASVVGGAHFVQTTLDATVSFPTFGVQSILLRSHAIVTTGDAAPPQRYSYLGGSSTLATVNTLERGGDELLFVDTRYNVPIQRVMLPYFGMPILSARWIAGGANVGRLGRLTQNIGARATLGFLRAEYLYDPQRKKGEFSAGIGFGN